MAGQKFDKPKGGGGGFSPRLTKILTPKEEVKSVDTTDEMDELDRLLAQADQLVPTATEAK